MFFLPGPGAGPLDMVWHAASRAPTVVVRLVTVKVTRMVGWEAFSAGAGASGAGLGAWARLMLTRGRGGVTCSLLRCCPSTTRLTGLQQPTLCQAGRVCQWSGRGVMSGVRGRWQGQLGLQHYKLAGLQHGQGPRPEGCSCREDQWWKRLDLQLALLLPSTTS